MRGDVLSSFTIQRLTVSDPKGVWIEADQLAVRWRPGEILFKRVHVQVFTAGRITVFRQPVLVHQPKTAQASQVTVQLDVFKARVQSEPAFSQARAVYDVQGAFHQGEHGSVVAALDMRSVLRPGDFLKADLDLDRNNSLNLDAEAKEVKGGGIAGSLGLAPDQAFSLSAHISGVTTIGRLSAVAHSGADTPFTAEGGWTRRSGSTRA